MATQVQTEFSQCSNRKSRSRKSRQSPVDVRMESRRSGVPVEAKLRSCHGGAGHARGPDGVRGQAVYCARARAGVFGAGAAGHAGINWKIVSTYEPNISFVVL
eukprot:4204023-Pyramimonas_sp.AAC.1